jgi:hypothetical protein
MAMADVVTRINSAFGAPSGALRLGKVTLRVFERDVDPALKRRIGWRHHGAIDLVGFAWHVLLL